MGVTRKRATANHRAIAVTWSADFSPSVSSCSKILRLFIPFLTTSITRSPSSTTRARQPQIAGFVPNPLKRQSIARLVEIHARL